jgi:hypothetical protein
LDYFHQRYLLAHPALKGDKNATPFVAEGEDQKSR